MADRGSRGIGGQKESDKVRFVVYQVLSPCGFRVYVSLFVFLSFSSEYPADFLPSTARLDLRYSAESCRKISRIGKHLAEHVERIKV